MRAVLLNHLRSQAKERKISPKLIWDTLINPNQIVPDAKGLKVAQKKYFDYQKKKEYLIRVIYSESIKIRFGITVYKTSKIKKYWVQDEDKI